MSDDELLRAIDNHEQDCNTVEANMLDSMMKQHAAGRRLSEGQRNWLRNLLKNLDERS